MPKTTVEIPSDHPDFKGDHWTFEKYGYSAAVRAGGLLFIAGVVGFRPDGTIPASVAEQSELAMRRTQALLRLEGLTMADLVEVVSYHVDLETNLPAFMPAKERYFEKPFPAWTIIGVQSLALPQLKVEVRSVAKLKD
jgi:enamine deaminase RidA (YjgF/YER057c/UK114 family)